MDKPKKLYMDSPSWQSVKVDDFLVAVGKTKSNSVYHVAEVKTAPKGERKVRHHLKVYKSDLITCLKRDSSQNIHPFTWYSRNKNRPN